MPPRYSAATENRDGVEVVRLTQSGDGPVEAEAEVVPAFGGNCLAFRAGGLDILEPAPFETLRASPTAYGIPVLFPFPNRVRDGAFRYDGRTFHADPPRHGFVRDKAWNLAGSGASDAEGAWATSRIEAERYPEAILGRFPFPFRLDVTYRLKGGALAMETAVANTGKATMPFGFGIHPYFRKPERGTVLVPASKRWELEDSLPTGKVVDVADKFDLRAPRSLEGLELDDVFTALGPGPNGRVECVLRDDAAGAETVVGFDAGPFPEVVVFTPPAPRRAVCVEPYTCPTDAFNLRDRGVPVHLIELPPGETMTFLIRFEPRPAP